MRSPTAPTSGGKIPFDVESIHRERAQDVRANWSIACCEPAALPTGRILLLLGDSGSGKTHLMRAFRNQVHSSRRGYCGYMQMTAFTEPVRTLRSEQPDRITGQALLRARILEARA